MTFICSTEWLIKLADSKTYLVKCDCIDTCSCIYASSCKVTAISVTQKQNSFYFLEWLQAYFSCGPLANSYHSDTAGGSIHLIFPLYFFFTFLNQINPPAQLHFKVHGLLPPRSSCKTSSVCVKIVPLCHLQGPRQCPLSSHCSNYLSVGPGRQMLSEPSSIRHSAAAWHTQYDKKRERKKHNYRTLYCHINSPPIPVCVFQLLPGSL